MHRRNKNESNTLITINSNQQNDELNAYEPSMLSSPTIQLSGHVGAVYGITFDPTGDLLASCSYDKQIFLWNIREECKNYNVLQGHKSGVIQVSWKSDKTRIVSCSADMSVSTWDANKGMRLSKLLEHNGIVNSVSEAKNTGNVIASGSDDNNVIIWDTRTKTSSHVIPHKYQVTSVCISDDGAMVYSGGIDNIIRQWDIRQLGSSSSATTPSLELFGCMDTVTGLDLNSENTMLLSNSMDRSLKIWDVRPFSISTAVASAAAGAPELDIDDMSVSPRLTKTFLGVHHGAEKLLLRCNWSANDRMVTGGSADRLTHIFDAESSTGEEKYVLPGHKASVNQCLFHPTQKLIASCSSDKSIIIGELL